MTTDKITPEDVESGVEWLCNIAERLQGEGRHDDAADLWNATAQVEKFATAYLAQAEEIERLRKRFEAADRLAGWVEGFIEDGCPKCGGDCSAANPPVAYCPIADAMADLAAYRATEGEA